MRYTELMPINEIHRPTDRQEVFLHLLIAGWQRVSTHGAFADVYQKSGTPYVLKVFDAHDEAYLAFIALARSHPNPHFPKFFGKLIRLSPNMYAIRMEPLTPYRGDPDPFYWYMVHRDRMPTLGPTSYVARKIDAANEVFESYPELKQACDLIIDNLLPRFEVDINQNNIMMRGDMIVLTDPIKNGSRP